MGREPSSQVHFRKMARQARESKEWSQAHVANLLRANGIDNMHPTTVAKIEAGDREVKLDEAAALADLFGMSLDVMLGANRADESSLSYALTNVSGYAAMAARDIKAPRQNAAHLEEVLEDLEHRFEASDFTRLTGLALKATQHLDSAKNIFDRIARAAVDSIANGDSGGVR